jgi:hypothetical protein
MTALRESLEASLQEHWDRATLEVYGDYLQSLGDPRGDLIAIDRQIRTTGLTRALARQRHAAVCAWLGGATLGERELNPVWFRDGFLELPLYDVFAIHSGLDLMGFLRDALASPAGPYLRSLHLSMSAAGIARALEILSSGRYPWLTRLELYKRDFGAWPADATITEAFFEATPWLHTLCPPRRAPQSLAHPALRRLELTYGGRELLEAGMPNIVEIQVAFGADELSALAPLFRPQRLPALRRLDLAPNEETERQSPYCSLACGFVASLEVRDQITHLNLPSVRSDDDDAHVRALLSSMPGLVELSIGRRYACFDTHHAELNHPAIVLPPPRPWPPEYPPGRHNSLDRARVTFSDGAELDLNYPFYIERVELDFDELAEPVRRAWCELWPVLAELEATAAPSRVLRFPAATLARALQVAVSLHVRDHEDADDGDDDLGQAIHERQIGPDETVELRLTSGFDLEYGS